MNRKSSIDDYADNIQETAIAIGYEKISMNLRLTHSPRDFKTRKSELDANLIKLDYFMNLYAHYEEKSGRKYLNFYEFLDALKKKDLPEEYVCVNKPMSEILRE